MTMRFWMTFFMGTALALFAQTLAGQAFAGKSRAARATDAIDFNSHRNEFTVFASYAPPPNPNFIGTLRDRHLLQAGLQYGRALFTGRYASLQYTASYLPVILLREPTFSALLCFDPANCVNLPKTPIPSKVSVAGPLASQYGHQIVYATGVDPIGFKLNLRPGSRFQPIATSSGGDLAFVHTALASGASLFNFNFHFGCGAQWFVSPRRSLTMEYRWQHISSASLSRVNPGLDANVIYLGYSFHR